MAKNKKRGKLTASEARVLSRAGTAISRERREGQRNAVVYAVAAGVIGYLLGRNHEAGR